MMIRKLSLGAAVLASTALTPMFASAQTASVEEIVVTAQRRAQNLQDVPIAVTAVTGTTAARLGLTDPIMLSRAIPGMQFNRNGSTSSPFIRGVGTQSGTIGNEPSVATFIDDVYVQSGTAGAFEMNNIEAVEVLKGPQGTLFGRNATGGLVNIRTKNPTYEPTMAVSAGYANYDTVTGQFYGSTGITDNLAVNLALSYNKQSDGWGVNIANGEDAYTTQGYGGRLKVLYEPTDSDVLLFNYSQDYRKGSVGNASRIGQGVFGRGGYSPDRAGAGFYDAAVDADDPYRLLMNQGSLKYTHDFDNARFVSITAYSNFYVHATTDSDTTPFPTLHAGDPYYRMQSRMFTQEFQLLSQPDSPVQWIIGTYFLTDKATFEANFLGSLLPTVPGVGAAKQMLTTRQKTTSYSGFAQATAEILPKTNMTIGVRYTTDERSFLGFQRVAVPNRLSLAFVGPLSDKETFQQLTGRFALDYTVTDDVMVYAAYNRGFKSGVYNLPSTAIVPVNPEELSAYSVGFKSQFADNRVRLNAEAYYYDYKNIQVVIQVPGAQNLTNAGAAKIKGAEIDLTVVPVENLTISGGLAITDGEYTKFPGGPYFLTQAPNPLAPLPTGCFTSTGAPVTSYIVAPGAPSVQIACDLAGNDTVSTPPLTFSLTAAYRIPTSMGPFDMTAGWTHGGGMYWDPANRHKEPTNDVFNASIQWSDVSERFSVRLWGQNLGQEKYASYATDSATSGFKYSPAPPRTYGVTVSAKY